MVQSLKLRCLPYRCCAFLSDNTVVAFGYDNNPHIFIAEGEDASPQWKLQAKLDVDPSEKSAPSSSASSPTHASKPAFAAPSSSFAAAKNLFGAAASQGFKITKAGEAALRAQPRFLKFCPLAIKTHPRMWLIVFMYPLSFGLCASCFRSGFVVLSVIVVFVSLLIQLFICIASLRLSLLSLLVFLPVIFLCGVVSLVQSLRSSPLLVWMVAFLCGIWHLVEIWQPSNSRVKQSHIASPFLLRFEASVVVE